MFVLRRRIAEQLTNSTRNYALFRYFAGNHAYAIGRNGRRIHFKIYILYAIQSTNIYFLLGQSFVSHKVVPLIFFLNYGNKIR